MTNEQRSELDRAIERAQRAGLIILARGTRKSDGARVWGVTSQSQPRVRLHQVVQVDQRLLCDCPARVICTHRAVVHLDLAREHAALEAAQMGQTRVGGQTQAQRRETSPVSYGDRGFSIWNADSPSGSSRATTKTTLTTKLERRGTRP